MCDRRDCSQPGPAGSLSGVVKKDTNMSDWLHTLPVAWMALLVFGITYLFTAAIYAVVTILSVGERARSTFAIADAHARSPRSALKVRNG
jgi:hypothetical protein